MIIDGGSSMNVVFESIVDRLKLPTKPHPNPYKVAWTGNTTGSYSDSIWCDVIRMNVTHILLGRPWLYD